MLEPRRIAARAVAQPHGGHARRAGRRDRRLRTRSDTRVSRAHPDRGRDRGHPHANAPGRPGARAHRLRDFRRISRAQSQRRSGPRALSRKPGDVARGSAVAGHVGDARSRASRALLGDAPVIAARAALTRVDHPLRGAPSRSAPRAADGSSGARGAGRRRRGPALCFLPGAAEIRRVQRSPRGGRGGSDSRGAAAVRRARRRRPGRGAAALAGPAKRSCWRPASPRPVSPSRASASSSIRDCAATPSSTRSPA